MTMWFDRKPGDAVGGIRVSQGSETDGGDPSTLLVTAANALPDWVKLPEEIGGQQLKVLGQFQQQCPMCANGVPVRHMECEQGFFVAECTKHGFAWYKRR